MNDLSRIRPKLRTTGAVTGNFGRAKTKAGSPLRDIGLTSVESIRITRQEEYIKRLYEAFDKTTDDSLKRYLFNEIRNIHIQNGTW